MRQCADYYSRHYDGGFANGPTIFASQAFHKPRYPFEYNHTPCGYIRWLRTDAGGWAMTTYGVVERSKKPG